MVAALSSTAAIAEVSAAPCPDVEVVFARGTFEPPGIGETGQMFVDTLRARLPEQSIDVYAVTYPASLDFPRAADGVIDAANRLQVMTVNCPDTAMVLGGYSQGAAVAGYVTSDAVPQGYIPPPGMPEPLSAEVADSVAAVALFGRPTNEFLNRWSQPPLTIGSLFAGKTLEVCMPGDPICSIEGHDNGAHNMYAVGGMDNEAADFVTRRLSVDWE